MNHISIEGMDGVGKSTTCELLAKKLDYIFVEKPLHFLFDKDEQTYDEYLRIRDKVNKNPNRDFTSLFYGLGSLYMYEKYKNENIITDRHLASNYAWSGTKNNKDVYDLLVKKLGQPKITVILYANQETILNRLKNRNIKDSDIAKVKKSEDIYEKMLKFCKLYDLNYLFLDTSLLTPEETVNKILEKLEGTNNG